MDQEVVMLPFWEFWGEVAFMALFMLMPIWVPLFYWWLDKPNRENRDD